MQKVRYWILIVGLWLPLLGLAKDWQWQVVAPGVEYASLPMQNPLMDGRLYVFRLDLAEVKLGLAFANSLQQSYATAREFADYYQALIALNGGFFTADSKPLGLRIDAGKTIQALKPISWWGIFYLQNNQAHISSMADFKPNSDINFAIQAGPRLVVNGQITRLKPGLAERTALGITRAGQVIIVVTKHAPLTLTQLAEFMAKSEVVGGLGCQYALNLDGGTSTQLYAKLPHLHLNVVGLKAVVDAVLVLPR